MIAGAGAKSDPHVIRALFCGPSIGAKTFCTGPCDHRLILQKPHRFAKIVNNSATKTSLAFILDANESPVHGLSFAVPFVSVLQVFFEIRQTEYRTPPAFVFPRARAAPPGPPRYVDTPPAAVWLTLLSIGRQSTVPICVGLRSGFDSR